MDYNLKYAYSIKNKEFSSRFVYNLYRKGCLPKRISILKIRNSFVSIYVINFASKDKLILLNLYINISSTINHVL